MSDAGSLRDEAFLLLGKIIIRSDPGRLEEWATLGLTMTQLRVLFLLRAEEGLSAGALAERLNVTPPTLTRIMDRLVRNELIERTPDPSDRRLVRHSLSRRGEQACEDLERAGRARMNDVFSRLSADQIASLVDALRPLAEAAEEVEAGQVRIEV